MHKNIVHRRSENKLSPQKEIFLVINLTDGRLNGRARHDLLMPYIV